MAQEVVRQRTTTQRRIVGGNLDNFTGEIKKGQVLKGVFSDILYYKLWFEAGRVIPAGKYEVFRKSISETDKFINSNKIIDLNESDTNLEGQGGQLPAGQTFKMVSMEVDITLPNYSITTPFDGSDEAINTRGKTPYDASAFLLYLRANSTIKLRTTRDRTLERGLLSHFPSGNGVFGFSGTANGVVQNGGISVRRFKTPRVFRSLQSFWGEIEVHRAIMPPADLTTPQGDGVSGFIEVALRGQLYDSVS